MWSTKIHTSTGWTKEALAGLPGPPCRHFPFTSGIQNHLVLVFLKKKKPNPLSFVGSDEVREWQLCPGEERGLVTFNTALVRSKHPSSLFLRSGPRNFRTLEHFLSFSLLSSTSSTSSSVSHLLANLEAAASVILLQFSPTLTTENVKEVTVT